MLMVKRRRKAAARGNSSAIRAVILADPKAKNEEVIAKLADQGIALSKAAVQYHRGRLRAAGDLPAAHTGRGKGKRPAGVMVPVQHAPVEVVEEDSATVPMAEYRRMIHNQRVWAQAIVLLATGLR